MGERIVRVGELVLRELSSILHSRWRQESVGITLTHADVAPDLRKARIYYTTIGNREEQAKAGRLFAKIRRDLKALMVKNVTLKYTPDLEFHYDHGMSQSIKVMELLDGLDDENSESLENDLDESFDESEE